MSELVAQLHEVFSVHRTAQGDAAALQGANLELSRGEIVGVLGPSGAGKSTLLRVMAGLVRPSAGVVKVLGRDVGRMPARAVGEFRNRHLGVLGQFAQREISSDLTARGAVMLPLALRGTARRPRESRADELLEAAGLLDRSSAHVEELSGGERQRLALAAALAHRPEVLLADEPTGELDRMSAHQIASLITELARAAGTTVLLASHDPIATKDADRILTMRDGRIVEERTGERSALVVGRGGALAIPEPLRREAGIRARAHARLVGDGLVLTPSVENGHAQRRPKLEWRSRAARKVRVELVDVVRRRGRDSTQRLVFDGLSHSFATGRLTVVTGRSGAGKTTLLRLVTGLDRPDSGRVRIEGYELQACGREQLAAVRRQLIGYMPQEPITIGFLTAHENVAVALQVRAAAAGRAATPASWALEAVGLAERSRQRTSRLSAGEIQRVALARALASTAGLLILDEPTSRLDEANAQAVAELLAATAAQRGFTVICSTHDPAVIARAHEVLPLEGSGSSPSAHRVGVP